MGLKEFLIEVLKLVVPVAIAYVGLLKTRTDLDILYAKHRGDEKTMMRKRWYHRLSRRTKSE